MLFVLNIDNKCVFLLSYEEFDFCFEFLEIDFLIWKMIKVDVIVNYLFFYLRIVFFRLVIYFGKFVFFWLFKLKMYNILRVFFMYFLFLCIICLR